MIRGIHHIGIHTPDLDRLKSFYEKAFGFEIVGEEMNLAEVPEAALVVGVPGAAARVVMMKTHNCFIELFEWKSPPGTTRTRRATAARPTVSDFAKTGSSAGARAADSANNIAMLRSRYGTEIRFQNTDFDGCVQHNSSGRITFQDLLIAGPNVSAGADYVKICAIRPPRGEIGRASCRERVL